MALSEYVELAKGTGILVAVNVYGEVDAALYTRPYFLDKQMVGGCHWSKKSLSLSLFIIDSIRVC